MYDLWSIWKHLYFVYVVSTLRVHMSRNLKSYPILRYPTLSYTILPYPTLSYPTLFYPILPYPTLSYPILRYPTLSYPILPYPTLSYIGMDWHYTLLHFRSSAVKVLPNANNRLTTHSCNVCNGHTTGILTRFAGISVTSWLRSCHLKIVRCWV